VSSAVPTKVVKDLVTHTTVGFVGSMSSLFVEAGVPLLRGQNIKPYTLDLSNLKFISAETHRKWKKSALQAGDVVIVRVGYPGTACVIPHGMEPLNAASLVIVRPDPKQLDSYYFCYVLNSPWGKAKISGLLVGSAQQVFNTKTAADFEIPCPSLPAQRKIASILSAYDDLIENNTRRIAILEEMAQAIYREWFVNFRFPGHENVKLVESALGKIPEGWLKPLGDVVTLKRGYDLPERDRRPGKVPIVSSSGVTDYHDTSMVEGPGVVTGRYGTLGKVFFVEEDFWPLNTSLYVREFHGNEPLLIVHLLQSLDLAKQNAAGAVPGLNRNALHMIDVVFPPHELQSEIAPFIYNIENQLRNLRKKNDNLRTTRDLLLPKLISGQLDVEDLDIDVGMTAEELAEAAAG
jgi:type I restriction enzyme, S subunit